jgi:hypothetical protein
MENFDYETVIHLIGKFGCHQTTLCTLIKEETIKTISQDLKYDIQILFETALKAKRDELIIENPEFLEYKDSPIVYLTVNYIKKF